MDYTLVIITLGSLLAAFVNATFATGGVYLLLAAGSIIFPMTIVIPLMPLLAFSSLVGRLLLFWKNIAWRIVLAVFIGSIFGVYFGVNIFVALPEAFLSIGIGILLIILIWFGNFKLPVNASKIFIIVGAVHSFIATIFGVGAFLQPAILRTELLKMQITGTLAACMLSMDIFKVFWFSNVGFSYLSYFPHILCATIAGLVGTWLGKRTTKMVSEQTFRRVFKFIVTLIALRLLFKGFNILIF